MLAAHYYVLCPFRIAGARLTVTLTSRNRRAYDEIVDAVVVGDQLVHRADHNNNLSIYRAGKLLGMVTMTNLGMTALVDQGCIALTDTSTNSLL